MEIWREVPGYDGDYECSTEGRVRSWKGVGGNGRYIPARPSSPRIMKGAKTRGDYLFVVLCVNGEVKSYRINRLVLLTFIGPPFDGAQACHNNGDNQDNRLENLRWGTPQENSADKIQHGTNLSGESIGASRLTDAAVLDIRQAWIDPSRTEGPVPMGARYGVSGPTLWKAATGKTWTHLPMPIER